MENNNSKPKQQSQPDAELSKTPEITPNDAKNKTSNIKTPDDSLHSGSRTNGIRRGKLPLIIIIFLLVLLVPLGGYFIFNQFYATSGSNLPTITPTTPTVAEEMTKTDEALSPTIAEKEMKTFTSPKLTDIGFSGYTLKYPTDWIKDSSRDENVGTAKLTLTKDGYSLIIQQGPMGGSTCVYEGDLPDGPALDERGKTYTDLVTGFGKIRTTKDVSGGNTNFTICQENESEPGTYGSFTSVGAMSSFAPADPDLKTLDELTDIIMSIQTL